MRLLYQHFKTGEANAYFSLINIHYRLRLSHELELEVFHGLKIGSSLFMILV